MIHNSIYTIPSRLFFKVYESRDLTLLTDEALSENPTKEEIKTYTDKLINAWGKLQEEDNAISNNKEAEKLLKTLKPISFLKTKQEKVGLGIFYLKKQLEKEVEVDQDVIAILKEEGYSFTNDLEKDLERIIRLNKDITAHIERLELKLPEKEEETEKGNKTPFDKVVISYGIITGLVFRPNDITQSEFRGLQENVKDKIEAQKNNGK